MLRKLNKWLIVSDQEVNPFEYRKKVMLINGLLLILLILVFEKIVLLFGFIPGYFPVWVLIVFNLLALFVFKKTQSLDLTVNIFLSMCFVVLFNETIYSGGIYSLDLVFLLLMPMIAFAFASSKSGFFWFILMVFSLMFYFGLELFSKSSYRDDILKYSPYYYLIGNLILSSIICGLFYVFTSTTDHFINKLVNQKKQIAEQAEELRMARQSVLDSNEELERYAYTTAHDLKQPLRAIRSFSELLYNEMKSVKYSEDSLIFLEFILNGSKDMENLITDLLQNAKMNNGMNSSYKKTNFKDIVEIVLNGLYAQISETGASVNIRELDIELNVIPAKIIQLFQNIISNALKYNSKDSCPVIYISCIEREKCWEFSVRDNGIGIPKSKQEFIFESFTRIEHDEDEYAGIGIGLSTCKKIVEQHKGEIWVESNFGEGSTFYFTISKNLFNTKVKRLNDDTQANIGEAV